MDFNNMLRAITRAVRIPLAVPVIRPYLLASSLVVATVNADLKEQTPELCMAAVKRDGEVLKYVKEQTPEICMAAGKKRGGAGKCEEE